MKKEKKIVKSELILKTAQKLEMKEGEIQKIINTFLDILQNDMKTFDKAVFRGFGTFFSENRSAKKGRNPKTGAKIIIPARRFVKFKAGDLFKDIINE